MAPKIARKGNHEHHWTEFEERTLLCLMAKGEHLAPRGKRTDDLSRLRQHAYLEVATKLNFACHGNNFDIDIDKRDVAKMIDRLMVEKKGVLGPGGYMERSTAGRITRGLNRMAHKNTKLDYDGSLSEWNNGRKAMEAEKLRIANGGAPRDDTDSLFHDNEGDNDTAAPNRTAGTGGDFWAQADVAATTSHANWRGAQAELRPSIEVDDDVDTRTSSVLDNGHDSFRQLPSSLRHNKKFQWAAGGTNLPPKPVVSVPGRGVATSRTANDNVHDRSGISSFIRNIDHGQASRPTPTTKPSSAALSYGQPADNPQSSSAQRPGGFADLRLNLPPKPPKQSKETRKVGFAVPNDSTFGMATSLPRSGVSIFSHSSTPPKKSGTPAVIQTMPLNRASSRDARLAYSLNAEIHSATTTQPKLPESSAKPKGLLQEAINPARRALMESNNGESSEKEDFEAQNIRAVHKITNANKEALPFNRLEKASSGSTGTRDLEMRDGEH